MSIGTGDLAKVLKISRQRINQLEKKGKITREADGKWDPETVANQLHRNIDARSVSNKEHRVASAAAADPAADGPVQNKLLSEMSDDEVGAISLFEAQRRHEIAKGRKAEMEVEKLKGRLIDAFETVQAWGDMITSARNRALLIPATAAPRVAVVSDVLECQHILDREIRSFLSEISEYRPNE